MALHGYNRPSLKRHDREETFQENKWKTKKQQPNLKKYRNKGNQSAKYSFIDGHWVKRDDA